MEHRQIDYKELAARTHLDARRIRAVFERDFAALEGANVAMTLKILERELNEDFSSWREEYAAWAAEHCPQVADTPRIAPILQGYASDGHKRAQEGSLWWVAAVVICALAGAGIFYADAIKSFVQSEHVSTLFSSSEEQTAPNAAKTEEISESEKNHTGWQNPNLAAAQDRDKFDLEVASALKELDAALNSSVPTAQPSSLKDEGQNAAANASELAAASLKSSAKEPEQEPKEPSDAAQNDDADAKRAAAAPIAAAQIAATSEAKTTALAPADDALAAEQKAPKPTSVLVIKPQSVAWLSIKDLHSGKTRNFAATKAHKLTSPSLVFVGTTAFSLNLGEKNITEVGRYFLYDGHVVKFISKDEYVRINKASR